MVEYLIDILASVVGTVGFCLFLRLRKHRLPIIAISTALCYAVYLAFFHFTENDFLSITVASLFAAIASELLAKYIKAPVTVFLLPTVLPLVPGAMLYYTISSFFQGEYREALHFFGATGRAIGGILIGIITVSTISKCIKDKR